MVKKKNTKHRVVLIIVLLVVVIVAALFAIDNYNDNKEREMFMSLRQGMKSMQVDFNPIDEGWVYDEYCRGVGSTVTREDRISCYVTLKNDLLENTDSNYNLYLSKLFQSGFYEYRSTERTPSNANPEIIVSVTKVKPTAHDDVSCNFADLEYAKPGSKGYYLSCSSDAQEFYFERRD